MRFRTFSLRSGLIAFILVGVALGLTGRWVQDIRRRGDAQLRVIAKCGEQKNAYSLAAFQHAPETKVSGFTEWMRKAIHPEYARRCAALQLTGGMLQDSSFQSDLKSLTQVDQVSVRGSYRPEEFSSLFALPGMKQLAFGGFIAEDDSTDWSAVRLARDLETFDCSGDYLSDPLARELAKLPKLQNALNMHCSLEALAALAEAPNLTTLSTSGGQARYIIENDDPVMTEAEEKRYLRTWAQIIFSRLANRDRLTSLSLRYSLYLEKQDLEAFCSRSPITELTLLDVHLSPDCLDQFVRLPKLKTLTISEDLIEDSHLPALAGAHHLQSIDIRGAATTKGIDKLRALLPNTLINGSRGPTPRSNPISSASAR